MFCCQDSIPTPRQEIDECSLESDDDKSSTTGLQKEAPWEEITESEDVRCLFVFSRRTAVARDSFSAQRCLRPPDFVGDSFRLTFSASCHSTFFYGFCFCIFFYILWRIHFCQFLGPIRTKHFCRAKTEPNLRTILSKCL
jgi:hypothetical protein